jgi:heptaprenyl diphosphate synthase
MSKRIAQIAVFTALALIFSYIEAIIPVSIPIPGVKLGITNIVIVTALYFLGIKEAVGISLIRVLLIGLLFGNILSLVYSFSGAVLSLLGMIICKKLKLTIIGVSAIGGVLHNIGQLIAAAFMLQSPAIINYYPVLFVSGLLTGILIGIISYRIVKTISKYKEKERSE